MFYNFSVKCQFLIPAGSETMTWTFWIGPWSSLKKHSGISIVMVLEVEMMTPALFRAARGILSGLSGAK